MRFLEPKLTLKVSHVRLDQVHEVLLPVELPQPLREHVGDERLGLHNPGLKQGHSEPLEGYLQIKLL